MIQKQIIKKYQEIKILIQKIKKKKKKYQIKLKVLRDDEIKKYKQKLII